MFPPRTPFLSGARGTSRFPHPSPLIDWRPVDEHRPDDGDVRARLKERYEKEIRPQLQEELGLTSAMQVPRVTKITLNMGVGEAKTDAKALDAAIDELLVISGQRAQVARPQVDRELQSPRGCPSAPG